MDADRLDAGERLVFRHGKLHRQFFPCVVVGQIDRQIAAAHRFVPLDPVPAVRVNLFPV